MDATTETRSHNAVNELTARTIGQNPQITLTYDDAGNLVQDGNSDGNHQYVWDYRNRLIEAKERQSGNWNTVGVYRYDAQGRRVRKVVSNKGGLNGTTRFLWGGDSDWQCLEERDGDDDLMARFTYSPGYIDTVGVQERDLNSDSDFADTNEVVYYQANTLFSVCALSDGNGSVMERYRFDAYGGATVLDADGSVDADGLSDVKNPYTFTGRRLDPESGLMQYRQRYYSPTLGRFVSRDPIGYGDTYALYGYVGAYPTALADPMGLGWDLVFNVGPTEEAISSVISNPRMPPKDKAAAEAAMRRARCQLLVQMHPFKTMRVCATARPGMTQEMLEQKSVFAAWAWGFGKGSVRGARNVVVGTGKSLREIGYTLADTENMYVELVTWGSFRLYEGDLSDAAKALASGNVGAGQYYAQMGLGMATLGGSDVVQGIVAVRQGRMTKDELSELLGGVGGMTLISAGIMKARGYGKPAYTPDQVALRDLVQEATSHGKTPLSASEFSAVAEWAREYKYPGFRASPDDLAGGHWVGGPHFHMNDIGETHIPLE